MTDHAAAIGRRVRLIRAGRGMSQTELGQLAGIARSNVVRLETGRHLPTLAVLLRVALALEVQPSGILCVLDEVTP